uniref:Minor capsid protein P9 transmembrane helices domain-containing protein n=1 Tax=Micromonas commoda virus TaxID=3057169 RepID=A0AAU7YMW3_9PHYC
MVSLFEDPKQVVRSDKVTEFWPTSQQTTAERVNATARFVIYATCILYLIRRDIRIFILGATVLSVLYVMEKSKMIKGKKAKKETYVPECQLPTVDNPMANVLMSDFDGRPDRPSACRYDTVRDEVNDMLSGRIPYGPQKSRSPMPDAQRNAFSRQFVSGPVTSIPGDQTAFAEWLYGEKGAPICKSDPTLCSPDARGVQLEAFGGLASNDDKRGGGFGGGNGPAA